MGRRGYGLQPRYRFVNEGGAPRRQRLSEKLLEARVHMRCSAPVAGVHRKDAVDRALYFEVFRQPLSPPESQQVYRRFHTRGGKLFY